MNRRLLALLALAPDAVLDEMDKMTEQALDRPDVCGEHRLAVRVTIAHIEYERGRRAEAKERSRDVQPNVVWVTIPGGQLDDVPEAA